MRKTLWGTSLEARSARAGIYFVLPAVGLLTLFMVVPVVMAFSLGFTNAKFASPNPTEFVGFDNFSEILSLGVVEVDADPLDDGVAYDNLRTLTRPAAETPYAGMQVLSEIRQRKGRLSTLWSRAIRSFGNLFAILWSLLA